MATRFEQILILNVAKAYARQLALADIVEDADWNLTTSSGELNFSNGRKFITSILGTQSDISSTWLWAWANPSLEGGADNVLLAANRLRDFGTQRNIPEFINEEVPINGFNGHMLSLVASGLLSAGGYYRGPYDGGAVFLLIPARQLEVKPHPVVRIIDTLAQVIQTFPFPHQEMTGPFLESEDFTVNKQPRIWKAQAQDRRRLQIEFDEQGRISNMTS